MSLWVPVKISGVKLTGDPSELHAIDFCVGSINVALTSVNHRIPFLDVLIDAADGPFVTTVFRKPTDTGHCLNGDSECPDKYKDSVVRAYVNRAIKHCSTWPLLHQEFQRIRQMLVNNKYKLSDIDQTATQTLYPIKHNT